MNIVFWGRNMNGIMIARGIYSLGRAYGYGPGYGYGFDWTYIMVLIAGAASLIASSKVKSTYSKYSRVLATSGLTGAQVAAAILKKYGMYDVEVKQIPGSLTDHYNPGSKTVNLSEAVYSSKSVAAIGVAAHECGHAMQHNEDYFPIKVRSALVPLANFGSKVGIPIIIAGVIFASFQPLIRIGIILFSLGVAFQIVTLPVEFDASRRALATIEEMGIVQPGAELNGSKAVLKSAAMTYVAAAASSVVSLLRLILIFGGRGRRRD